MSTDIRDLPDSEESRLDAMWALRCGTLYKAWVQVRYHREKQRQFDFLDKGTKAITVVLGATLMGQYFTKYMPWLGTLIASVGFLALVFGYGDRKQQHKELGEQAAKLIADIETVPVAGLSFERTAAWNAEYAKMIAKAPPPDKQLMMRCEEEQATADGHPPTRNWFARLFTQS
jgi:hypothetical protein